MDGKITVEHFTDMDKNIGTLAETLANCKFKLFTKKCKSCDGCADKKEFDMCYEALSVCGRLRVKRMAEAAFSERAAWYMIHKKKEAKEKMAVRFMIAIWLVLCLCCAKCAFGETMTKYRNDWPVRDTLRRTHSQVYDRNGDGKVNCIDYAVTFKQEWDKAYLSEDCEIIYNYNPRSGFCHLYVRCRWSNEGYKGCWLSVEPQAESDKHDYEMHEFWSKAYADVYPDIYDRCMYGYSASWDTYGMTERLMKRYLKN